MNTLNNKPEEKKKGFIPFLSRIFGGGRGVSSMGSVGSAASKLGGAASKGIWASIISSKAGVVGLVLGAATIAAGIGVIYNYIGPSSSKVYTPGLFSDAYYEDLQKQANAERAKEFSPNTQSATSSLDIFKEAAQKELSLKNENKEQGKSENPSDSADVNQDVNTNTAQPSPVAENQTAANKLNASLGFENKGGSGGGSSSGNRLQTSGGLWGGIGRPFSPISRNANIAGSGSSSKMNKALTARVVTSPKYTVPNVNKKGAFGQAKYAANVGKAAAFNASDAGARTTAEQAFSGETAGSGDIATPIGGTGLGGAGLSQGSKLKANDPSLNQSEYTPPTPPKPKEDTPWKKLTDYALYAMLASAAFIAIASLLANKAKALLATPLTASSAIALFNAAKIFCYLAMAAAVVVIGIGVNLAITYGQKWMGVMYGLVGGALIYQAYKALSGINEGLDKAKQAGQWYDNAFKGMSEGQQAQFKNFTPEQQWGHVNAYNSNPNGYMNGLNNLQGQNMPVDGKAMYDIPAPGTQTPTGYEL
jgi:hypothetical protein